jgi:hypothetical protein
VIIEAEGRKGDRLKCAAIDVVGRRCHYDAPKLKVGCALEVDPSFVALLLLKSSDGTMRTHAVATHGGFLLDSNEAAPLLLTRPSAHAESVWLTLPPEKPVEHTRVRAVCTRPHVRRGRNQ